MIGYSNGCVALCVVLAIASSGCARTTDVDASSDKATLDQPRSGDGGVAVDERMLASIKVEPVAERDTTSVLAIAGKVQFDEDRLARVLVPLAGQVIDLRVKVGDIVRRGAPLLTINSRDAAIAVAEHVESHKDLELAEKTAAMTEDLFQHEAASRIALQQAQSDLSKARSRVARTEEALRVIGLSNESDFSTFNGRVPVLAPIDRKSVV